VRWLSEKLQFPSRIQIANRTVPRQAQSPSFTTGLPFPRRTAPRRATCLNLVSASSFVFFSLRPHRRHVLRVSRRVCAYTNARSIRMPVSFDDAVFSGARRDYGDIVEHSDAAARYSLVESELRFHAGIG
jgi:hypothetical protein